MAFEQSLFEKFEAVCRRYRRSDGRKEDGSSDGKSERRWERWSVEIISIYPSSGQKGQGD